MDVLESARRQVRDDFERHGVFVGEHAFDKCFGELWMWIDIGSLTGQLRKHGLVPNPDAFYHLRDSSISVRKRMENFLTHILPQAGNYGFHLLYMCIRDARDKLGHQEAADLLKQHGVHWLPPLSASGQPSVVNVPQTQTLPKPLITTPAVSSEKGSMSTGTTVEKQLTREHPQYPVAGSAGDVPIDQGFMLHVGQTLPSSPQSESQPHKIDASVEVNFLPDIAGETQLIIESREQSHFKWKGYGLKLYIPENALPQNVGKCTLTIRALLPGQIELLPEHFLVSAVYQIKVPVKLARPVVLQIQHCASFENSDSTSLCFVVAHAKSKHPHRFQKLEGGIFSSHSSYGSISLDHFCCIGIIRWLGSLFRLRPLFLSRPLWRYCAQLYRICQQNPEDWGLHFAVTRDLDSEITAIREKLEKNYSKSEVRVDNQFPIQFQDDVITLSIPRDGVEIEGWKISCRHDPSITKAEVDSFRYSSGSALGCLFHIHWMKQEPPVYFEYKVNLMGAKPSRNFFTIIYPPLQAAALALPSQLMTTPAVSSGESFVQSTVETTSDASLRDFTTDTGIARNLVTTEPMLQDLMNLVAAKIPSKWKMIGIQLCLPYSELDCIEVASGDPLCCFSSVFTLWKKKETKLPLSWGTVLQALEAPAVGERRLARKISCQLTN